MVRDQLETEFARLREMLSEQGVSLEADLMCLTSPVRQIPVNK